jgi:hypothetical protein
MDRISKKQQCPANLLELLEFSHFRIIRIIRIVMVSWIFHLFDEVNLMNKSQNLTLSLFI